MKFRCLIVNQKAKIQTDSLYGLRLLLTMDLYEMVTLYNKIHFLAFY